jgi:hypothetical protein
MQTLVERLPQLGEVIMQQLVATIRCTEAQNDKNIIDLLVLVLIEDAREVEVQFIGGYSYIREVGVATLSITSTIVQPHNIFPGIFSWNNIVGWEMATLVAVNVNVLVVH